MKNKISLLFCQLALAFLVACGTSKNTSMEKDSSNHEQKVLTPVVLQGFAYPDKTIDYTIVSASMKGTILSIAVSYIGGCEEQIFELIFNGLYKKSLPRKADLFLSHNANGDTCKTEKSAILNFELSEIIGSEKQAVDFNLIGFSKKLRYSKKP